MEGKNKGSIVNHVGITNSDPTALAAKMIELGLCKMGIDELPDECNLEFACGLVLQVHKGDDATGVKPAIEIADPVAFRELLESHGVECVQRRPNNEYVLDFNVCGLPIHTVKAIE